MKLKNLNVNAKYVIKKINLQSEDKMRLYNLGFNESEIITVLLNLAGGGIIVDVKGTCIAVGGEVAKYIEVEKI